MLALMSRQGVVALSAERIEVLRLYRSLTPEEWLLDSGCPGWSVQDVLAHLASLFHPTPSLLGAVRGGEVEDLNDRLVDERRGWTVAAQLGEYETWSRRALHLLGAVQRRPLSGIPVRLGDLGTHPVRRLVDAAAFDHYTHLRFDLVGPRGPLERPPPPADPLRLRPIVSWMITLIPICSDASLADLEGWIELRLVGPGGGRCYLGPPSAPAPTSGGSSASASSATSSGTRASLVVGGSPPGSPTATITSTTPSFPGWATRRVGWRHAEVELSGDLDAAERVADAIYVF